MGLTRPSDSVWQDSLANMAAASIALPRPVEGAQHVVAIGTELDHTLAPTLVSSSQLLSN